MREPLLWEDDRFVRVVAAAVESLMQRSPQKRVEYDDVDSAISFMKFTDFAGKTPAWRMEFRNAVRAMMRADLLARPPRLVFKQFGWPWYSYGAREGWRFDPSNAVSQKEAELTAASAFTFPYPVQKVSDRAVELAKQIIETYA